jgi:hypothetical protein
VYFRLAAKQERSLCHRNRHSVLLCPAWNPSFSSIHLLSVLYRNRSKPSPPLRSAILLLSQRPADFFRSSTLPPEKQVLLLPGNARSSLS